MSASRGLARPRFGSLSLSTLCFFTLASLAVGCAEGPDVSSSSDGGLPDAGDDAAALDGAGDAGDTGVPLMNSLDVITKGGPVRGVDVGEVLAFRGIPYAKPPVGARRFMPPEPADPWLDLRQLGEYGPSCMQNASPLAAPNEHSEDCLTVNVFVPPTGKKLPVMLWIHGGAFVSGGSVQYDPVRIVREKGVIAVNFNYRLGVLGFFAHAALDAQRPAGSPSGNDGLRDQQLAMRWVKDNVEAFGGDPDNITLYGESSGGTSTCVHMVSPPSQGIAKRHIVQSGFCVGTPLPTNEYAKGLGTRITTELCAGAIDPIACLREKPAAELLAWGGGGALGAGFHPSINPADPLLPASPEVLYRGKSEKTPLLLGSTLKEWGLFARLIPSPTTLAGYEAAVRAEYPEPVATAVLTQYPATEETAQATYNRMKGDAQFRCPTYALARLAAESGALVFMYSFDEEPAIHALDIPYLFGNPVPALGVLETDPLHGTFAEYWTRFARMSDPNSASLPSWPPFDLTSDRVLSITKAATVIGPMAGKADCEFWARVDAGQVQ